MTNWNYTHKPETNLKQWYRDKESKNINGFLDFHDFLNWYNSNIKDGKCHYCGLKERDCQKIIHNGLLTSNRFPLSGKFGRGVNRGYWLEIDRKNPRGLYSKENCVPCCYFCNNDKSDVFTESEYLEFRKDRFGFLMKILNTDK